MPLSLWQAMTSPLRRMLHSLTLCLPLCAAALVVSTSFAHAVSIELKDEAPDRIERQRMAAMGRLPLDGTPDVSKFNERLAAKGLTAGSAVFIRIFKSQSELEIWMEKDGTFQLFDTYPICHWSGTLGPKTHEGDKQTPEGFYTVTSRQLHRIGRWRQALNLGFPNAFDQSLNRDGSYILVHGGCSSVGCFAMTNPVIEEIYILTSAALRAGQRHVPVHVFPFRMKDTTLEKYKDSEWHPFWTDLKAGYDAFEKTKRPPQVTVCKGRYIVNDASTGPLEAGAKSPLAVCGPTAAELLSSDKSAWLVPLQNKAQSLAPVADPAAAQPATMQSSPAPQAPTETALDQAPVPQTLTAASPPTSPQVPPQAARETTQQANPQLTGPLTPLERPVVQKPETMPVADAITLAALRSPESTLAPQVDLPEPGTVKGVAKIDPSLDYEFVPRLVAPQPTPGQFLPPSSAGVGVTSRTKPPCNLSLPSCRRYVALQARQSSKQRAVARVQRRSGSVASR